MKNLQCVSSVPCRVTCPCNFKVKTEKNVIRSKFFRLYDFCEEVEI